MAMSPDSRAGANRVLPLNVARKAGSTCPPAGLLVPRPRPQDKAKASPLCGAGGAKPRRVILDAGSGVLPPGRMCLLLGPPGGGRSTLLKALCGQLIPPTAGPSLAGAASACLGGGEEGGVPVRSHGQLRQLGTVSYNGLPVHGGGRGAPAAFDVARVATYVSQIENHLPELTVAETLTFAAKCQGSGLAHREWAQSGQREKGSGRRGQDSQE